MANTLWEILQDELDQLKGNWLLALFLFSAGTISIIGILSPIQAVYKWYRTKISDSDTYLPYVLGIFGSSLWLRYAWIVSDYKLALINAFALSMNILYTAALIYYRTKRHSFSLWRAICIEIIVLAAIEYRHSTLGFEGSRVLSGTLASGVQILGSLSCLYYIIRAVKSKCVDFIPFAPVCFCLLVEVHAITYGVIQRDAYQIFSNLFFFTMDGVLCMCFFMFPPKVPTSPPPEKVEFDENEMRGIEKHGTRIYVLNSDEFVYI